MGRTITEHRRVYLKKWQADNRERLYEQHKKWVAKNPEKLREKTRRWRVNHPEYIKELYFGSLERYEEAFFKYDDWCAFACDKEAQLVHHLDGRAVRNCPGEKIDNRLQNLIPLCRSCHTRLHHTKKGKEKCL